MSRHCQHTREDRRACTRHSRPRPRIALTAIVLLLVAATVARADVVLDWNAIAIRTMTQPPAPLQPANPFAQARFMSIVQAAVFEAVNGIEGGYEPYVHAVAPSPGASADAAAVAAAFRVLVTYFPWAEPVLTAERTTALDAIPPGAAKAAGLVVGETAAQALISLRANDGASVADPYVPPSTLPGEWQPTPTPPGAAPCTAGAFRQWRDLTPFAIPGAAPFIPDAPPDLTTSRYAKDFNEVKRVGGVSSPSRPQDRSDVARFYAATSPTQVANMAARQLAVARGDSLAENARTLALINIAINDSFIVSFATKYAYTLWRPVTAIRHADVDDNLRTAADFTFTPFITTPCFPSYPSNHASGTYAGLEVLRRIYGAAGHSLVLTNPALGLSLAYSSLNRIGDDVDDARVYGGIHFRFDQEAGAELGRGVATFVYKNTLGPMTRPR